METLREILASGKIKPVIDRRYVQRLCRCVPIHGGWTSSGQGRRHAVTPTGDRHLRVGCRPHGSAHASPQAFTATELRTIDALRTPRQVQRFLRAFPYNWERPSEPSTVSWEVVETLPRGRAFRRHGARTARLSGAGAGSRVSGWSGPCPVHLSGERALGNGGALCDEGLPAASRCSLWSALSSTATWIPTSTVTGASSLWRGASRRLTRMNWRLGSANAWSVEEALRVWPHQKIHMERPGTSAASGSSWQCGVITPHSPQQWRRLTGKQTANWL